MKNKKGGEKERKFSPGKNRTKRGMKWNLWQVGDSVSSGPVRNIRTLQVSTINGHYCLYHSAGL